MFLKIKFKKISLCLLLSILGLLASPSFLFAMRSSNGSETESTKSSTRVFVDSAGRSVEIPKEITRFAPSGAVATIFGICMAPEYMTCINTKLSEEQKNFFPESLQSLPQVGQLYGGKSTLNLETLLAGKPEIIIDLGDYKSSIKEDLDSLQKQTGIPCIFIEADLDDMAKAFRTLGSILKGKEERGEELAKLIEDTLKMAENNSKKGNKKLSVLYSATSDGLGVNAKGSSQAQVLELIGAENAVVLEKVNSKGGGNIINMEQLYIFNPDVILITESANAYPELFKSNEWSKLKAVRNSKIYEIPCSPYCWLSQPPSVNMILGIWWLGNLLYPEYYNYDIQAKVKELYKILWNYNLSDNEVKALLSNSSLK